MLKVSQILNASRSYARNGSDKRCATHSHLHGRPDGRPYGANAASSGVDGGVSAASCRVAGGANAAPIAWRTIALADAPIPDGRPNEGFAPTFRLTRTLRTRQTKNKGRCAVGIGCNSFAFDPIPHAGKRMEL